MTTYETENDKIYDALSNARIPEIGGISAFTRVGSYLTFLYKSAGPEMKKVLGNALHDLGKEVAFVTIGYLAEILERRYPDFYAKYIKPYADDKTKWIPVFNIISILLSKVWPNFHSKSSTSLVKNYRSATDYVASLGPEANKYYDAIGYIGALARDKFRPLAATVNNSMTQSIPTLAHFFSKSETGDVTHPVPKQVITDPMISELITAYPDLRNVWIKGFSTAEDEAYMIGLITGEVGDLSNAYLWTGTSEIGGTAPQGKKLKLTPSVGASYLALKSKLGLPSTANVTSTLNKASLMTGLPYPASNKSIRRADNDLTADRWFSAAAVSDYVTISPVKAGKLIKAMSEKLPTHPWKVFVRSFLTEFNKKGFHDPFLRFYFQPYIIPWLYATAYKESRFKLDAVGGLGELGYLQLMPKNLASFAASEVEARDWRNPIAYGKIAARFCVQHLSNVLKRYNLSKPQSYAEWLPAPAKTFIMKAHFEDVPTLGLACLANSAWQGGYNPTMFNPNSPFFKESLDRIMLFSIASNYVKFA